MKEEEKEQHSTHNKGNSTSNLYIITSPNTESVSSNANGEKKSIKDEISMLFKKQLAHERFHVPKRD